MELLRLHDVARLVGVSYPTIKQWIYKGKIKSVKTAGGHHRIPRSEVDRLTLAGERRAAKQKKPVGLNAISGRNKLFGKITEVRYEGLLAQVTSDAARDLGLKKGVSVYALVKATEVMVIRG